MAECAQVTAGVRHIDAVQLVSVRQRLRAGNDVHVSPVVRLSVNDSVHCLVGLVCLYTLRDCWRLTNETLRSAELVPVFMTVCVTDTDVLLCV